MRWRACLFIPALRVRVAAQQYAGDVISAFLPSVPGTEVAFFRIPDPVDETNNFTLINYYGHGTSGGRIVESNIRRALITVHGLLRDPWSYINDTLDALALAQTQDPNINPDTVAVIAPYFTNGNDKGFAYPWTSGLNTGQGSVSSALVWPGSKWIAGANNQYPHTSTNVSAFAALDAIIQYFDNPATFPNLNQIVLIGHSAGAQMVHRYAALGQDLQTRAPITYWIGNPNSFLWFNNFRPLSTVDCPTFDDWREGLSGFDDFPTTYNKGLVSQGRDAVLRNYKTKQIAFARALRDHGDVSTDCRPNTTGNDRHERFFFFLDAFPATCDDPKSRNCDTVDLVDASHDNGQMFTSPAGIARLFTDNFYGDKLRAYDFGYPRAQAGDDPYPDPFLVSLPSPINYNSYAGNMTYQGCWTNQEPVTPPALANFLYDNGNNSIDCCATECSNHGFSIAGVQNQTQCFCGNTLNAQSAVLVVDSTCRLACPGNPAEICGGVNRLSVFSNAYPKFE